jgi:hypothetical protein
MFILRVKKIMYKRIFVISILLIISILAVILHQNNSKTYNQNASKNIIQNIKYFNDNVLTNIKEFNNYFSDRYIIISNSDITIGKNKNELENGYYDVYIKIEETRILIYVNKLFKEFDKDTICDEIYVSQIVDYISKIFNLSIYKSEFSQLMITDYELIRDIDRNNVDSVDKEVLINNIKISTTVSDNMLLMKIGDK